MKTSKSFDVVSRRSKVDAKDKDKDKEHKHRSLKKKGILGVVAGKRSRSSDDSEDHDGAARKALNDSAVATADNNSVHNDGGGGDMRQLMTSSSPFSWSASTSSESDDADEYDVCVSGDSGVEESDSVESLASAARAAVLRDDEGDKPAVRTPTLNDIWRQLNVSTVLPRGSVSGGSGSSDDASRASDDKGGSGSGRRQRSLHSQSDESGDSASVGDRHWLEKVRKVQADKVKQEQEFEAEMRGAGDVKPGARSSPSAVMRRVSVRGVSWMDVLREGKMPSEDDDDSDNANDAQQRGDDDSASSEPISWIDMLQAASSIDGSASADSSSDSSEALSAAKAKPSPLRPSPSGKGKRVLKRVLRPNGSPHALGRLQLKDSSEPTSQLSMSMPAQIGDSGNVDLESTSASAGAVDGLQQQQPQQRRPKLDVSHSMQATARRARPRSALGDSAPRVVTATVRKRGMRRLPAMAPPTPEVAVANVEDYELDVVEQKGEQRKEQRKEEEKEHEKKEQESESEKDEELDLERKDSMEAMARRLTKEPSPSTRAERTASERRRLSQRSALVRSMCHSEKVYLSHLTQFSRHFARPLSAHVSGSESDVLFQHVTRLYLLHEGLANDIMIRLRGWKSDGRFADIFQKWAQCCQLYEGYGKRAREAERLLDDLLSNKPGKRRKFCHTLRSCSYGDRYGADGYRFWMRAPMSRVKYYLDFLQRLKVLTPLGHPDQSDIADVVCQLLEADRLVDESSSSSSPDAAPSRAPSDEAMASRDDVYRTTRVATALLSMPHKIDQKPSREHSRDEDDAANIWHPYDDDDLILHEAFSPYAVRYSTLNRLVELLTSPSVGDSRAQYEWFSTAFFETYRSFTTPAQLYAKLLERFKTPSLRARSESMADDDGADESLLRAEDRERRFEERRLLYNRVKLSVLKVLRHWAMVQTSDLFEHGNDGERLLEKLNGFAQSLLGAARLGTAVTDGGGDAKAAARYETELRGAAKFLANTVERKLASGTYARFTLVPVAPADMPEPLLPAGGVDAIKNPLDLEPLELARQITIGDYLVYANLNAMECIGLGWQNRDPAAARRAAPNLLELIDRVNRTSRMFSHLIVTRHNFASRKRLLRYIVAVAEHLLDLQNFSGLIAISSALQDSAVHRLKWTMQSLSTKSARFLAQIRAIFDPASNFIAFRRLYAQCSGPCVPFIGVFLSDITFAEDGNQDVVHGLINFHKRTMLWDIIVKLVRYQSGVYKIRLLPSAQQILDDYPMPDEDELYDLSLLCEPRGCPKPQK
jgi:RasGEF domain/RasGEF N-terminal motif/RhoGEF domain